MSTNSLGWPIPNADPDDLVPQIQAMESAIAADVTRLTSRQKYVASLTQSGTAAPSVTIGENSLFGLPILARSSAGVYTITLTGAFPAGRTKIFLNPVLETGSGKTATAVRTSDDVITISTVATDGVLLDTAIEIFVYPQVVRTLLQENGNALLQENSRTIGINY